MTLTKNQNFVIDTLRNRGAEWTADSIEKSWKNGKPNYIDSRLRAGRGIRRKLNQGNKETLAHITHV